MLTLQTATARKYEVPCLGEIYLSEILSFFSAAAIGLWWFFARFEYYSWVLQNMLGMAMCMSFLSVIRLPSLKVATILLLAVFIYDIFFVFITPYIFNKSVMVEVAQGGPRSSSGTPTGFCDRYPDDSKCDPDEEMPILLKAPRLLAYDGGYALLGLGDIVLPGLLLVFALRIDYLNNKNLKEGTFKWILLGYAVGLAMANLAVYIMQQGQPALLYLVPLTLGPLTLISWREGTLETVWKGPSGLSAQTDHYQLDHNDAYRSGVEEKRLLAGSINSSHSASS